MAFKKYKYRNMNIDMKLYDQIMGFKKPGKSFRDASKDFAEHVGIIEWRYKGLRKKAR